MYLEDFPTTDYLKEGLFSMIEPERVGDHYPERDGGGFSMVSVLIN